MSREFTEEEIRNKFLDHIWSLIHYWDRHPTAGNQLDRLEGLTHSILATIDGCTIDLPKFIMAPDPHPDDKQYHIDRSEDYFPDNDGAEVAADIGGTLHELLYTRKPGRT